MLFSRVSGPDRLGLAIETSREEPQDPSRNWLSLAGTGKTKKEKIDGDSRPGGASARGLPPSDWAGSPPPRPTPCSDRFQTRRCGVERGGLLHVHVSGLLNAVILML